MNWKGLFAGRKKATDERLDLELSDLQVGYLVDYDLRTWQVTGRNVYDYDGERNEEWVLQSGDEIRFLEGVEDDGTKRWTWTRKIDVKGIAEPVADIIAEREDPPEEIHYEGRSYRGVESSAGLFLENGEGPGREFIEWTYETEDGHVLFLSQWGEREFSAYEGVYVEEYQFTDILPRSEE